MLRRFARDRSGNFAIISAIAAAPLIFAVGLGLEYSDISAEKAKLQSALDSASLAVAREGIKLSNDMAYKIADEYVRSNFTGDIKSVAVNRTGYSVAVSATTEKKLAFGTIMGNETWKIVGQSVAEYAPAQYELSLVLDTTGSMEGAKLAAMKAAVNTLIDALSVQVTNKSALKVGVVPYATFVNVGPQYGPQFDENGKVVNGTGADWLDTKGLLKYPQQDLAADVNRFELYHALGFKWPGCVETRMDTPGKSYALTDEQARSTVSASLFAPTFAIDEPDDTWPNGFPKYPNNYIKSAVKFTDPITTKMARYGIARVAGQWTRDLSLPLSLDTSPSIFYSNESDPKGPGYGCETEPLLPLTSDLNKVKSKVSVLKANGSTNITEGVLWGWRTLSDREPFSEGSASNHGSRKIMIVLTDGTNSYGVLNNDLKSGYTSTGYLDDNRLGPKVSGTVDATTLAMNAQTLTACTNAKNDGVEIFTIRLEEPNMATGTLLQSCASGNDHFFDSPNHDQLESIFKEIKDKLVTVRLAS
ncbi:hypothetical protein CSC94_22930 [Zhengella mangrovi]|uniref:VWFA domain-containing protein n=1 Tax=Zhengella mangrovi TaxID=1982044 RepID=A0A2G1QGQ0_9HYPH|nr:pilus assembly protein [Zhengella mangrovi]PHP64685.1 hypothetical protein CSC94_22930 [Zhengella mangrovi]